MKKDNQEMLFDKLTGLKLDEEEDKDETATDQQQ
jgi:hypothetical protein